MIGFLNIYKPSGMTSFSVVNKIKRKFNIKKIGHMGTLDPMACGVLPIAIGKATRLFDYALQKDKVYRVIFQFGYTTDTLDKDGIVTISDCKIPTKEDVCNKIKQMIGKCNQIPPNFSAKKINGQRAYDLARTGIEFELKPKEIEIYSFEFLNQVDESSFEFIIKCSSGTYIRSIGRDLASMLDTHACMTFLERVESGVFIKDNAIMLDDILNSEIDKHLISPLQVFENFDRINIDENTYKDLLNGKTLTFDGIKKDTFVLFNSKLIGVAKANDKYLKLSTYLGD